MSSKAKPAARPDLDVAMFDFADEYARGPRRALERLQFLLLHEDTCLARVAWLNALRAAAGIRAEPGSREQVVARYRDELALLCEEGAFAAHASGRLTPERARRLHQVLRDPDALLEAHRRLGADEDGPALAAGAADRPTAVAGDTSVSAPTGFTALVRAGRLGDLEDRLRPWLPFVLRRAGLSDGLDEALARQFLAYLRARVEEARDRRFRELLPVWLASFAREQGLAGRLRADRLVPGAADVEAGAVTRVLSRPGEGEPGWAGAFRESALGAGVQTAPALLAFEPAGLENVPALPNYRRDLFREARRARQEGLELFECEVSS